MAIRVGGSVHNPFLAPVKYTVTLEASGFKSYRRSEVPVNTNEQTALDITLDIGQASEIVSAMGGAPLVETDTPLTGQVNNKEVEDMPLNGRTPLVLAQLAFGVILNTDPRFYSPFGDSGPWSFAMGGGAAKQNELLLDDTPDFNVGAGLGFSPPVDAVTSHGGIGYRNGVFVRW